MGFLKQFLCLRHIWHPVEHPCPGCGRLIRLLTDQPTIIRVSAFDSGQVRTGFRCGRCRTLYYNSCAPHRVKQDLMNPPDFLPHDERDWSRSQGKTHTGQCFCGSSDFRQVVIERESPPCYSPNERDNCKACGLLKRFCRCDFYVKWGN